MAGSDFNDLAVQGGGQDAVRQQLLAAAELPSTVVPLRDGVASGRFGRWTLDDALRHVSLIYGTDTVFDGRERLQMRLSHFRHIVGKDLFREWSESKARRIIKGLVFEPAGDVPEHHMNLFEGFPLAPGTRGARGCPKILQHIYRLCGRRDAEFEWLLRWMAYPLQHPGAKMATSVIMHGAEGTGKSLIWDKVISAIYGKYAITVGQLQIESQFTGWQSCKCFAQCEEVVARNEQAHYKGKLKHLVSGTTFIINEKNLPERAETNHMNMVFLSNSEKPLSLDLGDRRYLVLKIMEVPDAEYFAELVREIEQGGVAEFYQHLLTLDLQGFNAHTKPPLNEEKRNLIGLDLPNALLFFEDWKDGLLDVPYGCATRKQLFAAYRRWSQARNEFSQRERDFVSHVRRFMDEARVDIRLPDDFKDRKTQRCWVPFGTRDTAGVDGFTRQVERDCQKFELALADFVEGGRHV